MIDEKKLIEELKKRNYQLVFSIKDQFLLDRIIEIIREQSKIENTVGFKHFLLLADSTLKSQNKEYLLEYIHMLYRNWKNTDCDYNRTIDYANELHKEIERLSSQVIEANRVAKKYKDHNIELMNYIAQIEREFKDNSPIKLGEILDVIGKPIWCKKIKKWFLLREVIVLNSGRIELDLITLAYNKNESNYYVYDFEENRFYRREVKE